MDKFYEHDRDFKSIWDFLHTALLPLQNQAMDKVVHALGHYAVWLRVSKGDTTQGRDLVHYLDDFPNHLIEAETTLPDTRWDMASNTRTQWTMTPLPNRP